MESATSDMVDSAYILGGMTIAAWVMFSVMIVNCCISAGVSFLKD